MNIYTLTFIATLGGLALVPRDASAAAGLSLTDRVVCDAPTCTWTANGCTSTAGAPGAPDACQNYPTPDLCEGAGTGAGEHFCRIESIKPGECHGRICY